MKNTIFVQSLNTFVSEGNKGHIVKMVAFQHLEGSFYNMALVDFDEEKQIVDDEIIINNGDMGKVLATTWKIMLYFLDTFPEKLVVIEGNTEVKHQLYKRLITNNLLPLKQQYKIFGVTGTGEIEIFSTTNIYISFIIQNISI